MPHFEYNTEYLQGPGDLSLTAPPATPNEVFLQDSGAEGFAGDGIGTEYIVMGSIRVYRLSSVQPWVPGHVVEVTIQVAGPATYDIHASGGVGWSGASGTVGGGYHTIWDGTFIFGSTNESFSFSGHGFAPGTNYNFIIDFKDKGLAAQPPQITSVTEDYLGSDGNFDNASNWSPTRVPGASNDVRIASGTTVNSSAPAEVASLSLNNVATNAQSTFNVNSSFLADHSISNYGTINVIGSLTTSLATNNGTMRTYGGLINFGSLTNTGVMSADAGGEIEISGATVNNGKIYANPGGTVYLGGSVSFTVTGGSAPPNSGIITPPSLGIFVNGGNVVLAGADNEDIILESGQLTLYQPAAVTAALDFSLGNPAGVVIDLPHTVLTAAQIRPDGRGILLTQANGQTFGYQTRFLGFNYVRPVADGAGGTALVFTPGVPTDMLMRQTSNGALELYGLGANTVQGAWSLGAVGLNWQVAGFGDFSSLPREADMLMRNGSTGAFEVYDIANNAVAAAYPMGAVGLDWTVGGFGAFSGNANESDMIMRNTKTGALEVYDIAGNTLTNAFSMGAVGLDWQLGGFGNFSGNANETDMIMRNTKTGALEVYDISHNALTSAFAMGAVGLDWTILGFGNFSGTANETDMLMQNTKTGALEVYDISHNALTAAYSMGAVGLNWQFAGVGAFGYTAGETDLLMRDPSTGQFQVYDIRNNALSYSQVLGTVGTNWSVSGIAALPTPTTGSGAGLGGEAGGADDGAGASIPQLVQAMAGFGGGSGAADSLNTAPMGADTSQQTLLTASQHS